MLSSKQISKHCLDYLFQKGIWAGYSVISDAVNGQNVHFIRKQIKFRFGDDGHVPFVHQWQPSDEIKEFLNENQIVWKLALYSIDGTMRISFSNKKDATKFILMYGGHRVILRNKL